MSHINRNINSIHNYYLTPSLKKYIECLTIHDNTFTNIYIVYLHIFSSMFYNPYAKSCRNPFGGFRYKWGQRFWHTFTVSIATLLRWGSTFLWSLVKIGSSVSENLVGQVHSEKKRNNNNNNNKIWYDLKDHNMAPQQRISICNIIIYLETKFCPKRRMIQNGRHSKPKWLSYGWACLTPCKYPFPLKSFHFWILNNLFLFFYFYIGGHFENFKNKEHNFEWWSIFVPSFKRIRCAKVNLTFFAPWLPWHRPPFWIF